MDMFSLNLKSFWHRWQPHGGPGGKRQRFNASETKNNKSRICANVISPFFPSVRASQCAVQIKGLISSLPTSYFVSSGGGLMDRSLHVLSWSEDSAGGAQGRCPYHRTLAALLLLHRCTIWVELILGHFIIPHTKGEETDDLIAHCDCYSVCGEL